MSCGSPTVYEEHCRPPVDRRDMCLAEAERHSLAPLARIRATGPGPRRDELEQAGICDAKVAAVEGLRWPVVSSSSSSATWWSRPQCETVSALGEAGTSRKGRCAMLLAQRIARGAALEMPAQGIRVVGLKWA
ncbi:hypothetical protein GCM10023350_09640 [Nocardioides endophyticus]|uniref:Uncharacterized protein n=1 Tax=Nocardioides endophyticus TaxID=1353775 RepID=A0ABP8YFA0_9ACTN